MTSRSSSFAVAEGGGGPQSNLNMLPYLVHIGLYVGPGSWPTSRPGWRGPAPPPGSSRPLPWTCSSTTRPSLSTGQLTRAVFMRLFWRQHESLHARLGQLHESLLGNEPPHGRGHRRSGHHQAESGPGASGDIATPGAKWLGQEL